MRYQDVKTEEDSSEKSSESRDSSKDKEGEEEPLHVSSPSSQHKQEGSLLGKPVEAEPSSELGEEVEQMAPKEHRLAEESSTEAMEVAPSEATSTVDDLTPMHSQDTIMVHAPEGRSRVWTKQGKSTDERKRKRQILYTDSI